MGGGDAAASVTFPLWAWLVFIGLVVVLLVLDLFVLHRNARKIPFRESLWLSAGWISISLAFGGFVWFLAGPSVAGEYLAAYLVEWSLSLDNVFVFAVIFSSFAVPEEYRYHVLFWGVIGALVARAAFVLVGIGLLSAFSWLVFVFGAFLIFTGIRMLRNNNEDTDYQNNRALKYLKRRLPVTEDYRGDHFIVRDDGKRYATPLLAVLIVIESSDVLFAIDSVPAVLSITSNTFVAYSSIAFAILGLRALYFALEGLIDRFVYLHYGLAAILVFVGVKFILEGFGIHIPIYASLIPIAAILAISILVSMYATRGRRPGGGEPEKDERGVARSDRRSGHLKPERRPSDCVIPVSRRCLTFTRQAPGFPLVVVRISSPRPSFRRSMSRTKSPDLATSPAPSRPRRVRFRRRRLALCAARASAAPRPLPAAPRPLRYHAATPRRIP